MFGLVKEEDGKPLTINHRGAYLPPRTHVKGSLNLSVLEFRWPIDFDACVFDGAIIITNAKLGPLSLKGAEFPSLSGDSVRIAGDLDLPNCDAGAIELRGSHIEGSLWIDGAQLNAKGEELSGWYGRCLNCNGAEISDNILLRRLSATGVVNLQGVKVGGQIDCSGGTFSNAAGKALNCAAATIGADVFLSDGFTATGEVSFQRATITGQLSCISGTFTNAGGRALMCDAATIRADVFLRNGFSATGEVNFLGATITGQIDCSGGMFTNAGGTALFCDSTTCADVFLRYGFSATGEVNFRGATISGQIDCSGGTFTNGGGTALMCNAATFGASVFLRSGFSATGEVNFTRAKVEGNFQLIRASLDCAKGDCALDLEGATVSGTLFFTRVQNCCG
ncbi:MAG: hypothetical protein WAW96_09380, partial [Alphaproteobacteria bacterium]